MKEVIAPSPQRAQKTITLVYIALLTGQLLFGLIAVLVLHPAHGSGQNVKVLTYLVPLVAVVSVLASTMLFTHFNKKAIMEPALSAKMAAYQVALITCYAPLESASLFAIVAYIISGNLLYVLVSALLIARFITIRPTVTKTSEDLKLNYDEQQEIAGNDMVMK